VKSIGVRIGDFVLDIRRLAAIGAFGKQKSELVKALQQDTLNAFMALSTSDWSSVRTRVTELLKEENVSLQQSPKYRKHLLVPVVSVEMHLPALIGDYTDFFSSYDHAKNTG
jgi:fumarylacetoacetase